MMIRNQYLGPGKGVRKAHLKAFKNSLKAVPKAVQIVLKAIKA